jgi:hypothetical protein
VTCDMCATIQENQGKVVRLTSQLKNTGLEVTRKQKTITGITYVHFLTIKAKDCHSFCKCTDLQQNWSLGSPIRYGNR